MKVCCGSGKTYNRMTEIEKLGCNHDHCVGPMEVDEFDLLLTGLGTFNTEDCISTKDIGKLLDNPTDWEAWITSQIEQEGIEKYTSWYARMFERGAICEGLQEAHNEIFGEKE